MEAALFQPVILLEGYNMKDKMHIYYDKEGDFLEIGIGKPVAGYHIDIEEDISKRINEKSGKVIGITVLGFRERFDKAKELKIPSSLSAKADSHYDSKNDILCVEAEGGEYWKSIAIPGGIFINIAKDCSIKGLEISGATVPNPEGSNKVLEFVR